MSAEDERRFVPFNLTVNEKILVHLLAHSHHTNEFEMPREVTQDGIADSVGIRLNHVPRSTKGLIEKGLVTEKSAGVVGIKRRRKVYILTDEGKIRALGLKKAMEEREVTFRPKEGEPGTLPVSEVRKRIGPMEPLLGVVEHVTDEGIFDEAAFRGKGPVKDGQLVEFCAAAPRLTRTFLDRTEQLRYLDECLSSRDIGMVTVHGVEGVGKTSLLLKLLEGLKGERSVFWHSFHQWDGVQGILDLLATFLSEFGKKGIVSLAKAKNTPDAVSISEALCKDLGELDAVLFFDNYNDLDEDMHRLFSILLDVLPLCSDLKVVMSSPEPHPFCSPQEAAKSRHLCGLHLKGLDRENARTLYGEGGDGSDFDMIYDMTKGHPLTLEMLRDQEHDDEDIIGGDRLTPEEFILLKYLKTVKKL